jgi:hypothetical protein
MSININSLALAKALNDTQPAQLSDMLRTIGLGSFLRRASATLRRQNPNLQAAGVASAYDLATLQTLVLPDDAKAKSISRAFGRVNGNSITLGELTVAGVAATPTTGQIGVSPAGNIVFLGTDLWSDVDVDYTPADQDVVELTLPVVSSVLTIPSQYAGTAGSGSPATGVANVSNNVAGAVGVNMLMEVESLVGTVTGKFIVVAPSASAPGTTKEACLSGTKGTVLFKSSDAVTSARVKLGVFRAIDMNALLEATCVFY